MSWGCHCEYDYRFEKFYICADDGLGSRHWWSSEQRRRGGHRITIHDLTVCRSSARFYRVCTAGPRSAEPVGVSLEYACAGSERRICPPQRRKRGLAVSTVRRNFLERPLGCVEGSRLVSGGGGSADQIQLYRVGCGDAFF